MLRFFARASPTVRSVLCLGGLLAGCAPEPRTPDILLVTIDTLRADHLGCYGYEQPTSPNLDALARAGALFETAYAPVGTTCPSHASLMTGRYPIVHGVVRNGFPLVAQERTLAEWLSAEGWYTAAFVSSYPVSARFGFAQGFAHFDDAFKPRSQSLEREEWAGHAVEGGFDRFARATVSSLEAWLADTPTEAPLFVWLHLFDPHDPYRPPPRLRGQLGPLEGEPARITAARYDEEILYADEQIGVALEAFAKHRGPAQPLCVVTADHGEGLGDHGWPTHNRFTYEEEVRVPLIVHWPERIASARLDQPAHLIDVLPTLAGLLELAAPPEIDGVDLAPYLRGERPADTERTLYLQRPYYRQGRERFGERGWGLGVRSAEWKLFQAEDEGQIELYHLERDPGERTNLANDEPEVVRSLSERLDAWFADQQERAGSVPLEIPDDALEGLEALGYLEDGGLSPASAAAGSLDE